MPFGELSKQPWDRDAFLRRPKALAVEAGAEPLDGKAVDRANDWIRYGSSPAHLSVDIFPRAGFRARNPEPGEDGGGG